MADIFTEQNGKVTNRMFSIKLLTPDPNELNYQKILKWQENLNISFQKQFPYASTVCPEPEKQKQDFFVIHHKKNYRSITVSSNHIQYDDKKITETVFKNISKRLYDLYVGDRKVDLKKIQLVGTVCDIQYKGEGLFSDFRERYGFYPGEGDLKMIELRTKFIRDKFNIHLYLFSDISVNDDDDDDDVQNDKDKIYVKIDINNTEQTKGISDGTCNDVVEYSKKFIADELLDILNSKIINLE